MMLMSIWNFPLSKGPKTKSFIFDNILFYLLSYIVVRVMKLSTGMILLYLITKNLDGDEIL